MEQDREKISEKEFKRFSDLVYKVAGINLHIGKRELLQARVGKILRQRGIGSFSEYFEIVTEDPSGDELVRLIDAISTNMTFFFREEKHFQFLTDDWLTKFMESRKRGGDFKIRGWSAGCSTGEEPYSIVMAILEKLAGNEVGLDIKILASDISTRVLQTAMRGTYIEEKVKSVPASIKGKYFDRVKGEESTLYHVKKNLVDRILFRRINLMEPFPLKNPVDFIFCRNVMIYFDRATQQDLVNKYHQAMKGGGYLFIGHSESLNGVNHPFKYVAPSIYQRA